MPGAKLSSVGVSGRTRVKSDVAVCEGVPAAVAVLSEAGSVERATRAFVDRFDVDDGSLASCPHEVELITAGQADRLTVLLDGLEADLVAVVDADGRRMAVLTIPTARDAADIDPVSPVLEEPLDESAAIVWGITSVPVGPATEGIRRTARRTRANQRRVIAASSSRASNTNCKSRP